MKPPEGQVVVKPYSTKEFAALYGLTPKVFKKWIKPIQHLIGPRNGRYYTTLQVRIIFDKIGLPCYYTLLFLPLFLPSEARHHIAFELMQGEA